MVQALVRTVLQEYPGNPELTDWLAGVSPDPLLSEAVLGQRGVDALRTILDRLPETPVLPDRWDAASLRELRKALANVESDHTDDTFALRMIDDLSLALEITSFTRRSMPDALTTSRMKRALSRTLLWIGEDQRGAGFTEDEVDYLERIALEYPAAASNCLKYLVAFVLRLAIGAGMDTQSSAFDDGLRVIAGNFVMINDLRQRIQAEARSDQTTIVISLHGTLADDWPEIIYAWLLDERDSSPERMEVACSPTKEGVEGALSDVLEWASARVKGSSLKRIDVALPTGLLLQWHPEEAAVPVRLGLHHDVVVRWSHRLNPPPLVMPALWVAEKRMETIQEASSAPVDWLEESDVRDAQALLGHLQDGKYQRALGLQFAPVGRKDLLELLLGYSPIVLWPNPNCDRQGDIRSAVEHWWMHLPQGFAQAYREKWQAASSDNTPALADVRAVWDDADWLRFCRRMRQHRADLPSSRGEP
jgi:hypothetical protein